MQAFESLSSQGQVRRLSRLAHLALEQYDLGEARLEPITHWENTTFRVDVPSTSRLHNGEEGDAYEPGRLLLRVHSPGYQTPASIASEMMWLRALREETILSVPIPISTARGDLVAIAHEAGVPQPRACSLLRWVRGRFSKGHVRHYEALGETMARLHNHASRWTPPPHFTRLKWDWDGFFGEGAGLGEGHEAWSLLPREHHALFERVAEHTRRILDDLGQGPQAWGLIHADLHWNNVLLSGGVARPIDFDDCGWGHWAYDFAVVLGRHLLEETPQALAERQALERGYARHRPLPHDQLVHLKSFAAARSAALTLWVASRARDNPTFRERLPLRLDRAAQHCRLLLGLQ